MQPQYDRIKAADFGRKQTKAANNAAKSFINKQSNDIINARKEIQQRVESGEYNLTLSKQHYLKHIEGTKQYDDYLKTRTSRGHTPQSRITISDIEAQDIITKKYGTGEPRKRDDGTVVNIEFVNADKIIGKFYSNGQWIDTKRVAIHYGKYASHIVPVEDKNG